MKNATKMARYMMMRGGRDGGNYERENEVRNGYGSYGNEGGNYARDNYGVDNRFRDRRGREHYDNGRFAPRNDMGRMESDYFGPYGRRDGSGGNYGRENRGSREGEMRRGRSEMNWGENEEEGRMNQIGFDRPREMESNYPNRIDFEPRNEMERGNSPRMSGGAKGAEMELTPEIAIEWTSKMHNEDGTKGEHWTFDQVKKLMSEREVQHKPIEVYAIMNALYSDYCKVFKKYGFNSPLAYLDLAIAWLDDEDAVPNKAMMYYECIVK